MLANFVMRPACSLKVDQMLSRALSSWEYHCPLRIAAVPQICRGYLRSYSRISVKIRDWPLQCGILVVDSSDGALLSGGCVICPIIACPLGSLIIVSS